MSFWKCTGSARRIWPGLCVIWIHPQTVVTVEEGSILDCNYNGSKYTLAPNVDLPDGLLPFSAMPNLVVKPPGVMRLYYCPHSAGLPGHQVDALAWAVSLSLLHQSPFLLVRCDRQNERSFTRFFKKELG